MLDVALFGYKPLFVTYTLQEAEVRYDSLRALIILAVADLPY